MSNDWPEIQESAKKLCSLFGLPQGFFEDILKNDDWTFIIRIHALLETAVTWTLEDHLSVHQMREFLLGLNLSGRTGKLALIESFGILDQDAIKFITGVSKLRNRVVHNIRHIQFDLPGHLAALRSDEQSDILKKIGALHLDQGATQQARESLNRNLVASPKKFLLSGTMLTLAILFETVELRHCQQELEETKLKHLRTQARLATVLRTEISESVSRPDTDLA